ncbi:MAG: SMI1/KNR4 family protein [Azoarcus sp.]|jgi:hypothetical protein|nr:SMI1/KNR4 family protein [Azoarcus sp.]
MRTITKGDKPYLFEDGFLSTGFRFPESYLHLVQKELPDIEPWGWLASYKELSISWMKILQEQFPYRTLIPFAKFGGSDDIACFDGTDTSGDPKVLFIHTFCSPGWEDRGTVDNFDGWLKGITEESRQFKLEREED